jgi:Carbohydrate binding domain
MKIQLLLTIAFFFSVSLKAQVNLDNSSFEGNPNDAEMPNGWHSCNPGTTPDILPGPWGVVAEASEGNTYLGLITRDNGEWESVGQRLKKPLKAEVCYSFSLDLAHSKTYNKYNNPIKLKIWGGKTRCSKDQLLAESKVITHSDWVTYEFTITPNGTINYIIFEAFFGDDNIKSWKGNILIDNCTEIKRCDRA